MTKIRNNALLNGWCVIKASCIVSLFCCLCACHQERFEDLAQYIDQLKQTETKEQTIPRLQLHTPKAATYQASSLRSPFVRAGAVTTAGAKATTNPLQAYPLTMLRLAGTVSEGSTVKAYLLTPENMLFQVKVGDSVGDQNGKVIEILPDRLNVMEIETGRGKPSGQRVVTLQLKGMP